MVTPSKSLDFFDQRVGKSIKHIRMNIKRSSSPRNIFLDLIWRQCHYVIVSEEKKGKIYTVLWLFTKSMQWFVHVAVKEVKVLQANVNNEHTDGRRTHGHYKSSPPWAICVHIDIYTNFPKQWSTKTGQNIIRKIRQIEKASFPILCKRKFINKQKAESKIIRTVKGKM